MSQIQEMDPRKVREIWQFIYDAFWFQVEAIKSINQKGHNLLSEAHGLKQPQVALHHRGSSTFSGINLALLGVTTLSNGKDPFRFRREDQLDGLCKKGEPTLVMPPTFSWSMENKSSGKTPSCGVLAGGFSRLCWSLGKPLWPRLNLRWSNPTRSQKALLVMAWLGQMMPHFFGTHIVPSHSITLNSDPIYM